MPFVFPGFLVYFAHKRRLKTVKIVVFLPSTPLRPGLRCATIGHSTRTNDLATWTSTWHKLEENAVSHTPKYFIVEADAMPEIFRKVAQAKRLLETGEETTVNGAAHAVGISRSAYYKYKDTVRPFQDMLHGRIVTFQILLKDEPGVLSGVLNVFGGSGGNILTINQTIPSNGCAVVTVSAETSALDVALDALLDAVRTCSGVLRCEILAG